MMTSCWGKEGRLRALLPGCLWLSGFGCGLRLGREGRVALAVEQDGEAGALLVGEGGADAPVFLLAVGFDGGEEVEGRYLFLFGRFGLCCHSLVSFFRV